MSTPKVFYPRREERPLGRIIVPVTVTNLVDPTKRLVFDGLIDTGAFGLILPLAWKETLGNLPVVERVEVETADQRVMTAETAGPVQIEIPGFRRVASEVAFIPMEPTGGRYEPLVGYTVLELAGIAIDLVSHRLVARRFYDLKRAS